MLFDEHIRNCPVQAPGIVISATKTLVKTGNTYTAKANGYLSLPTTTADLPALDTAERADGSVATEDLADGGYQRLYTFIGAIDQVSCAITYRVICSEDLEVAPVRTDMINQGTLDENEFILGFLLVQTIGGGAFTPDTSELDDFNYVCIDNYGFVGA